MDQQTADEDGMAPLERGRRRYQMKEYEGALGAFGEAVNMSTGHMLLKALDHRAAAHEKLLQFQPALQDAKRMIELKPELSKGYLRCGKVLQLKGKPELAFKIYERGLNKVKIGTDDERTMLQTMFNKAKRALDPQKILDPLVFLPTELAEMVCQYLTIRDRVICLAVSKPWKRLLESSHKLWTTLDTSYAKRPMNFKSLKAHLKRSNYTLDHAIVMLRAALDAQKMTYITRNCKNLQQLDIRGSGLVGDSLTTSIPYARNLRSIYVSESIEISASAVQKSLTACCKTITEASFLHVAGYLDDEFPQLHSLKRLHVKWDRGSFDIDNNTLAQCTPNLESLILNNWTVNTNYDFTHWAGLQHLDLTKSGLALLPYLPASLKHLILNDNLQLLFVAVDRAVSSLPLLETLACKATCMDGRTIKNITRESIKRGNLKSLSIGNRIVSATGPIKDEFPASETVENLSIGFLDIQEERILQIVTLYPNLRRLDISGTKATGVAVKVFVQMGLQYLKLNECSNISSDAVEWARGQGVEVEYSFPSRSGGARGFRDRTFAAF